MYPEAFLYSFELNRIYCLKKDNAWIFFTIVILFGIAFSGKNEIESFFNGTLLYVTQNHCFTIAEFFFKRFHETEPKFDIAIFHTLQLVLACYLN